jgi:RNA polymerase sigma-70 factor (ECF subfamily)
MAAEDIVSETMLNLWNTLEKETVEYPQALLLSMLKNAALNYLRRQEVKREAMENMAAWMINDLKYRIDTLEACNPEEIYSSEIMQIVDKTLASLPRRTRRIFEMRRYELLAVKEIAESLSMKPKTIEYHFTKALKALRAALNDYLPLFLIVFIT